MTGRILPDLTQPTIAELLAKIAQLEAAQAKPGKLSFKVTAKRYDEKKKEWVGRDGALSVYGLGQFPTTLYRSQWERLLDHAPQIRAFIAANEATLARKE